eukprot:11562744-Alexandrium_andersonii.AAC.1
MVLGGGPCPTDWFYQGWVKALVTTCVACVLVDDPRSTHWLPTGLFFQDCRVYECALFSEL